MRHFLLTFIALWLAGMANAETENLRAKKLIVGYFDLPPHAFHKKSGLPSAAISYFDKIAKEMGTEVEYMQYPLDHLVFLLDHQRLDAALFLAKNDARKKTFSYPAMPYFTMNSVFVVPNNSDLKSAQDIDQKSTLNIIVWPGGFHSTALSSSKNNLTPLSGNSVAKRGVELIMKRRFDAFFSPDRTSVEYQINMNNVENDIRILPIPGETIDIYTVFTKQSALLYLKSYERALKKVSKEMDYPTFFINFQKNHPPPKDDFTDSETDLLLTQ